MIEFSDDIDLEELRYMSEYILMIMIAFHSYTQKNGLPCRITSTTEAVQGRKEKTHAQGRAFDASSRGFSSGEIFSLLRHFNTTYPHIAAISSKTGKKTLVTYHKMEDGEYHFHFQVRWIDGAHYVGKK